MAEYKDEINTLFIYEYAKNPAVFIPSDLRDGEKEAINQKEKKECDFILINEDFFKFIKRNVDVLEGKGFSVLIKIVPNTEKEYIVLRPLGIIGVFKISDNHGEQHLNIVVLPKIFEDHFENNITDDEKRKRINDFLTMLNYAYDYDFKLRGDAKITKVEDIVNIFVLLFLEETAKFVQNKLKRYYVPRREYLNSRVRGKILVGEYVTRCLPQKRDNIIPCEFYEFSMNILENQIIKYATYLCQKYVFYSPWGANSGLRNMMQQRINRIMPYLWNVELRRINLGDFKRVRKHGFFGRYEKVLKLAKLIILHLHASLVEGGKVIPVSEFSINTAKLFEKFLYGVIHSKFGNVMYQKNMDYTFKSTTDKEEKEEEKISETEFDFYITEGKDRLIIDSKYYREVFSNNESTGELQIKNINIGNIYQIVSYCSIVQKSEEQQNVRVRGALVYPRVGKRDNLKIFKCTDFGFDIFVVPISLYDIEKEVSVIEEYSFIKRLESILHENN